ncbi:MAG TPA: acyl-CoA thioesterase domain-containing protein [Acidimicrobiales bacterium]|jgi:acyl-CoA thioesterase|nr:acyl-CoA thioesterase domain-containing protein [Acidimicrobiales bacterium]
MAEQLDQVVATLDVAPGADGRCLAQNLASPGAVVFGGQMIAQAILAATRSLPDKSVRSVHTVFARGAAVDTPLELTVQPLHSGRAVGSVNVTFAQGDRLCAQSLLLLSAEEPDFVRHDAPFPSGTASAADSPEGHDEGWWQTRIVGGVDFNDPALVGPPELQVWSRVAGTPPDDQALHQALLAYGTEGFLIATAMRPHEGVGQALAHRTVSTSVLTHTVTFHEAVRADQWNLLDMQSTHASRGRAFGRGQVFDSDGNHVASIQQESLLRAAPERSGDAPLKY